MERGIAAFVICASLIRQFEFAQNVWVNDRNFHELGNERDPIIGNQDGTLEFKIPKRPIRKKITGLPAFTTVRGGAYFFLPGIKALRYLAALGDAEPSLASNARGNDHEHTAAGTHLQPRSHCPQIHAGQTPHEHLLDVELPMGIPARPCGDGKPLLNDDRSPHRPVAELRDAGVERSAISTRDCGYAGAFPPLHAQLPADCRRSHRPSGRRFPAH